MSGLGEWDDADGEPAAAGPPAALTAAVTAALAAVDVGTVVQAAVKKAVQRRVDAIAAQAVHSVVDADVDALARLRTAAEESVTATLTAAALQDDPATGQDDADQDTPALYHPTVEAFVRDQLAPMYRRDLEGRTRVWCPQWWRHPEAITRLDALWRAWEHLRLDPATGMSVWFRDHADHHMPILFDPEGPFKRCAKGHGERLKPLPVDAPPQGLFAQDR